MATTLRWLGHGCWLVAVDGKTVLVDPFLNDSPTSPVKAADVKATGAKVDAKSKAMSANAAVTTDEHKTVRKDRHHSKESQNVQSDVTKPAASDKRN